MGMYVTHLKSLSNNLQKKVVELIEIQRITNNPLLAMNLPYSEVNNLLIP